MVLGTKLALFPCIAGTGFHCLRIFLYTLHPEGVHAAHASLSPITSFFPREVLCGPLHV